MQLLNFLSEEAGIAMKVLEVRLDGVHCSSGSGIVTVSVVDHERRFIGRADNAGDLSMALDEALRKALGAVRVWYLTERPDSSGYLHHTLFLGPAVPLNG